MTRSQRFRKQLSNSQTILVPGCYDVLSALVLEHVGFEQVFLSGYGVAASSFGRPDIGLTGKENTVQAAENINSAIRCPLLVDIDDGYGTHDTIRNLVQRLEALDIAGVVLEDQVPKKKCGHLAGKQVISAEDYLKKLRAAIDSRKTDLVIVARTDAQPLDEAIRRANLYHEAGADITLIDGLSSVQEVERVSKEVHGLKQINLIAGGKTPDISFQRLAELNFKIVLYSTPALFGIAKTLFSQMKTLKQSQDLKSISAEGVSLKEFQSFIEEKFNREK